MDDARRDVDSLHRAQTTILLLQVTPSMTIEPQFVPIVPHGFRLQWEEVQDCYVILYPEGMAKLSPSAGEIMKRCDGERTVTDIIEALAVEFPGANLIDDVFQFLESAYGNGWLRSKTTE
jgi:pyrroloquinoline quinone biosynthesis protein D